MRADVLLSADRGLAEALVNGVARACRVIEYPAPWPRSRCRGPCTRVDPGRSTAPPGAPSVASPAMAVATSQSQSWPALCWAGGRTTSQALYSGWASISIRTERSGSKRTSPHQRSGEAARIRR